MPKNLGMWDRVLRVLLGAVILMFVPRTAWAWLGVLPLATGLFGYCALYRLFGWSTYRPAKAA